MGVIQFLRLLQKTDVHGVWLAKGGRKRLKIRGLQLTNHLIMHGTNLVLMAWAVFQFLNLKERQNHKKMGAKMLQMS